MFEGLWRRWRSVVNSVYLDSHQPRWINSSVNVKHIFIQFYRHYFPGGQLPIKLASHPWRWDLQTTPKYCKWNGKSPFLLAIEWTLTKWPLMLFFKSFLCLKIPLIEGFTSFWPPKRITHAFFNKKNPNNVFLLHGWDATFLGSRNWNYFLSMRKLHCTFREILIGISKVRPFDM